MVAPVQDKKEDFNIAFASACITYHLVFPFLSSHRESNPFGVQLYPSDITLLFLTIIAPTFFFYIKIIWNVQ
jgi:hypothetical protein